MICSFSHLAKDDTNLRVFSVYSHDTDNPGYRVRAVLIKDGRAHYIRIDKTFKNIGAAETYRILFVLGCRDKGYKMCPSSRM